MLVNDFGSAVKLGLGTRARKGNPYFAPAAVLASSGDEYDPQPAHDLETFVKVLSYGLDARVAESLQHTAPEEAASWWAAREKIDLNLRALLVSARTANYAELKQQLRVLTGD